MKAGTKCSGTKRPPNSALKRQEKSPKKRQHLSGPYKDESRHTKQISGEKV